MKTTGIENVKLDYLMSGEGSITLLFIHGAFIDKNYWQSQLDYFSKYYRVVCIDLAGHGLSGNNHTEWSIQVLAEDIVNVIITLDLSDIILIGHSLGGDVILEVADKIPERIKGFVGIDNFKNAGTAMPPEIQQIINQALVLMQTDFAAISGDFARQSLLTSSTDNVISERIMKDYMNFNPQIGLALLKSSFTYYDRERELLQKLRVKLYLINIDYIPTNETLLKMHLHSGYEIYKLKGSCHYPMIENPDEFNQLLEKIILKITSDQ